jgi:hypothetical protein
MGYIREDKKSKSLQGEKAMIASESGPQVRRSIMAFASILWSVFRNENCS